MKERLNIQAISDRIDREVKEEFTRLNIAHTKVILVDVILAVTGWTALEPWAEDAIDRAISGKRVNIARLKSDIENWKAQRGGE